MDFAVCVGGANESDAGRPHRDEQRDPPTCCTRPPLNSASAHGGLTRYDPGMARSYSAREIAIEARVSEERVAWLDSLGVLRGHERGGFTFGSILVTKLISALLEAGTPAATIELITAEGWLNLGNVDEYLPHEPGERSSRSFDEFRATM